MGEFRTTATISNDYPIFTRGNAFLLSGTGMSGTKVVSCNCTPFTSTFMMSKFLRRGTVSFAQLASFIDRTIFAIFDLLNGVVRNNSAISATTTPWGNEWYRCTLTTASTTANAFAIFIVSSATCQNKHALDQYIRRRRSSGIPRLRHELHPHNYIYRDTRWRFREYYRA